MPPLASVCCVGGSFGAAAPWVSSVVAIGATFLKRRVQCDQHGQMPRSRHGASSRESLLKVLTAHISPFARPQFSREGLAALTLLPEPQQGVSNEKCCGAQPDKLHCQGGRIRVDVRTNDEQKPQEREQYKLDASGRPLITGPWPPKNPLQRIVFHPFACSLRGHWPFGQPEQSEKTLETVVTSHDRRNGPSLRGSWSGPGQSD